MLLQAGNGGVGGFVQILWDAFCKERAWQKRKREFLRDLRALLLGDPLVNGERGREGTHRGEKDPTEEDDGEDDDDNDVGPFHVVRLLCGRLRGT